ncbi:helix-turn-helix domain-containing protein [Pontibacter qinzhouensis]|uniref:Helix-turn-helix domain-containing protein n=1 Tax=Pontibacter qinzhouensis TaxID=2603253 RepID=A0A5C8K882_9BACT|nr:chromate resistance protein ChrB domain-containing protein [Pontibacter qinzhouensis]TXK49251.1 helix-turn-helix domain-containing protein [Pontibacter qinzhouensis]
MNWITRERPKVDRIACPWLIRRFIDNEAIFYFVPYQQVLEKAQELQAIPFDIPEAELTHYNDRCTFDFFLEKYKLTDEALHTMAPILRGADTDDHSLTKQSAGLWAISVGLSVNIKDDYELLEKGMVLYDALYTWAKQLQGVKHLQQPTENLFLQVFNRYMRQQKERKKVPAWAQGLKEIIQDQVDTNLSLSLSEIAKGLEVHPAYVSREFAKYFDNMSYGEYIRKLRIEKALHLLQTTDHSLSEIAYLTGFSDQSHFTRIFKKFIGQSPSEYKKSLAKGKKDSKG